MDPHSLQILMQSGIKESSNRKRIDQARDLGKKAHKEFFFQFGISIITSLIGLGTAAHYLYPSTKQQLKFPK